jgi:hypothetical protein
VPAGAHAPAIADLAARYVREAGYRGIGGIEFKRDPTAGRFVIVEPTVGRTDWQSEVATLNGVNLPLIAMLEALDRPVPEALAAPPPERTGGIGWRSSVGFRLPLDPALPGLRLRDGYFRLADPLPGLYYYVVESFARRVRRRVARLFQRGRKARHDSPPIERSASTP